MPETSITYRREDRVATITMDDGKRNALSPALLQELGAAFDQAERDGVGVVLTGREEVFSAGFDLKVLRGGAGDALRMLRAGYSLPARLLDFPQPIVAASGGHALAMGVFLLLSTDYRIGVTGEYKYGANEVAIGLPMPRVGAELLRLRISHKHVQRAAVLAESFSPEEALEAGFLDRLVPAESLLAEAHAVARGLMELDMRAHAMTKRRMRAHSLATMRRSVPLDLRDAVLEGVRGAMESRRRS